MLVSVFPVAFVVPVVVVSEVPEEDEEEGGWWGSGEAEDVSGAEPGARVGPP